MKMQEKKENADDIICEMIFFGGGGDLRKSVNGMRAGKWDLSSKMKGNYYFIFSYDQNDAKGIVGRMLWCSDALEQLV